MYTLETLCHDIGLPEEVIQQVLSLNTPAESRLRHPHTWDEGLEQITDDPRGLKMLSCQLNTALDLWKQYQQLGISQEIFVATMGCYNRFVGEHMVTYGCYGFDRGFWTVRQLACKLFRIGQLEYELSEEEGQPVVKLHIPSNAKLELPLLRASWEAAKHFLSATFPEYAAAPYICGSWLLSPNLKDLLPANSRILAFQSNFNVVRSFPDESFREWVFKDRDITNDKLTENTSLQKSLKAFVLAGNQFHSGGGILSENPFL